LVPGATNRRSGRPRRVAWAVLMRRTWGIEVFICARRAASMRLVEVTFSASQQSRHLVRQIAAR
jgi:hypothetical protein